MTLYSALKLIHQALVANDEKYQNLLMQNVYYIVPIVNPDGVALIEKDFTKTFHILNKRKNMSPNAAQDAQNTTCLPQDSGVDLNRNYGVDWGVGAKTQIGLDPSNKVDECANPCGECYRGSEPFSEPETRAVRDFLRAHKDEVKFVYNFHSNGNMWIYPFNGRDHNDILERAPTALCIFQEIANEAPFPAGMSNNGNAKDIIGEKIGGDGDDYILGELNIPSVTAELGTEGQYIEEWQVKNVDEAVKICADNSQYLEFTYEKLGAQLALVPVRYEKLNDQFMRVFLNVTNKGMSDFANIPVQQKPPAASFTQLSATDGDDWIRDAMAQIDQAQNTTQNQAGQASSNSSAPNATASKAAAAPALAADVWAPEIQLLGSKSTFKASLVEDHSSHPELIKLMQATPAANEAPQALVTGAETFTLPPSIQNLKTRETQALQFIISYSERPTPLGVDLRFQY